MSVPIIFNAITLSLALFRWVDEGEGISLNLEYQVSRDLIF